MRRFNSFISDRSPFNISKYLGETSAVDFSNEPKVTEDIFSHRTKTPGKVRARRSSPLV